MKLVLKFKIVWSSNIFLPKASNIEDKIGQNNTYKSIGYSNSYKNSTYRFYPYLKLEK